MYSYGPSHMAKQKQDDQLEFTCSSYVMTQDVTLKTCPRRWMIGRSGERGSGISVLAARHDDDDDDVLTNAKIWSPRKYLIVILTIFSMFHDIIYIIREINRDTEREKESKRKKPGQLGLQNTTTVSLEKGKRPPTSVLHMTLNIPMVMFQ